MDLVLSKRWSDNSVKDRDRMNQSLRKAIQKVRLKVKKIGEDHDIDATDQGMVDIRGH